MSISKPVPVPDASSEGFWTAAAAHSLAIQRCEHCGHFTHPPAIVCPACCSTEPSFRFAPVSGRGVIKTWTIMHDAFLPAFRSEVPYVVVDVELEEQPGLRVVGRLVDGANPLLEIGATVETVFDDVAPGIAVPAFRLFRSGA
jgi:uncharacterized protein